MDTILIAKHGFITSEQQEMLTESGVTHSNVQKLLNGKTIELNVYNFFCEDTDFVCKNYSIDVDENTVDAVLVELDDEAYEEVTVTTTGNADLVAVNKGVTITVEAKQIYGVMSEVAI